jgi:transcription antitermination factor NusG
VENLMETEAACCSTISNRAITARDWFVVSTVPRHEKRVEQHFHVREIESFLPLYHKPRRWKDGSKGTLNLPLFSGYVFVRIETGSRVPVLQVPGVISIVGGVRESSPVPDSYICCLRDGLQQGKIDLHPYISTGTRVRIRRGVMAGLQGVLLRKKNQFRVVLTLELIMKSVTVEVDIGDIEPVMLHPHNYS